MADFCVLFADVICASKNRPRRQREILKIGAAIRNPFTNKISWRWDLVNYFNKTEQLKDHGYSKILRLRNTTDLDELRDKAADRTEWQGLVEILG